MTRAVLSRRNFTSLATVASVAACATGSGRHTLDEACHERVDERCYAISDQFPFDPRYVSVHRSRMHYVESGAGAPILFVHGNPTWSYLWRNILPYAAHEGRAIALDLIGMGRSDKPDIEYRFADHARYFEGFVEALDLNDITLVVHDWGSGIGLDFARRHPEKIRALVMMEAALGVFPDWESFPASARASFRAFRTPDLGRQLIMEQNIFVERVLPASIGRPLSEREIAAYRAPFPDGQSRRPGWRFPNEGPIAGGPADGAAAIEAYVGWLRRTGMPKLLFHVDRGSLVSPERALRAEREFPNLTRVNLGAGGHFMQEEHPHRIGMELQAWLQSLVR